MTLHDNTALLNPISTLRGIGPKSAEKFHKLGIFTINDLLFHLPYRYEDRTSIKSIRQLLPGTSAVVEGEILDSQLKVGRRRSLLVRISDGSGFLTLRFFHFSKGQQDSFTKDKFIQCYGEIRRGPNSLEITHPEYSFTSDEKKQLTQDYLTPVYHSTEGMHQTSIRKILDQALDALSLSSNEMMDLLPNSITNPLHLPGLKDAILQLHRPTAQTNTQQLLGFKHPSQQRLILEELLAHHLSLKELRNKTLVYGAPAFDQKSELTEKFIKQLPFELTGAQQRVIAEITQNQSTSIPMLRLVQGDVGSGKTVVAMAAALQAISSGWQVALMAPTETLAEQHFQNFTSWAEQLNINVGWLTGKLKRSLRKTTLEDLAQGRLQLLVGTHALFQDEVKYKKLGLIIIDEQHRFGVHQRLALKEKGYEGNIAHQLIMTATPIPRTLAMTAYADLDLSIIDELPKGRQHIDTVVLPDSRREQIIQRVSEACKNGRQVYWVCPLIEESELLDAQAAENTAENLQHILPELTIGLVHGRMKSEQKSGVIAEFKKANINLLVATTVIEVGVDVPNASLMIIENAERLGLSQLHQLRGRVGRGSIKSNCVLMYNGKLSKIGHERLSIMRETNDGFAIAEKDLELRGPGELLGTKQTGLLQLRVADITRDQYLFPIVEKAATKMFKECPENITPLIQRWLKQGLQYGNV
ncbi:MAG: ATP-dependent DNA helicase RecG [Gammaproteobacteria bacterium]|nr:ATP-dependent DNA helicase RecG [Gammaproteobacteria bacterium]